MHEGVRIGIVVTITAVLISGGIFLLYSIQVGRDIHWLHPTAIILAVAGGAIGISTWVRLRTVTKEFNQFRDDVKSRLVIRESFNEDELLRSVFPGEDR
jgi:hypothetical protein